jgi:hypothetical protein
MTRVRIERQTDVEVDFVEVPVGLEDNIHVVQTCYLWRSLYNGDLSEAWAYVLVSPEMVQQSGSSHDQCYAQIVFDPAAHLISLKHLLVRILYGTVSDQRGSKLTEHRDGYLGIDVGDLFDRASLA